MIMRLIFWLMRLRPVRRRLGGETVSVRPARGEADYSFEEVDRRLKQAEADVLAIKAGRASDPLTRELLLAQSSLASLRAKQIEDRLRSSSGLGRASS